MKKGYKAILIAAAILLGTGAMATTAGLMMGARMQDMEVDGKSVQGWYDDRSNFASMPDMPDVPSLPDMPDMPDMPAMPDMPQVGTTSTSRSDWTTLVSESYTNVTSLELSAGMGDVFIKEGDGFSVVAEGKEIEITSRVDNGNWRIETNHEKKINLKGSKTKLFDMTITVPKGWYADNIEVALGMGTLEADLLAAHELVLDAGMGRLTVEKLASEEASITCAMGQIDIDSATLGSNTVIDCGMGQLAMTIEGKKSDYGYHYSVGMGSITMGDDSSSGIGGERSYNLDSAKMIEASCGMGQITVDFTE